MNMVVCWLRLALAAICLVGQPAWSQKAVSVQLRAPWAGTSIALEAMEYMVRFPGISVRFKAWVQVSQPHIRLSLSMCTPAEQAGINASKRVHQFEAQLTACRLTSARSTMLKA